MNEAAKPMDGGPYRFHGQPLTPAVIESLILELCAGQLVQRQTILEEVSRSHLSRGGKPPRAQSAMASLKKALGRLQRKQLATNPSLGYWRIAPQDPQVTASDVPESARVAGDMGVAGDELTTVASQPALTPDQELGSGQGVVYLYYLPTYRQRALDNGEAVWFCKIGRTERDPLQRILDQAATALPERPHIALLLRTDAAPAWETALQSVLPLRGRKVDDSPGSEWFLTSPDEVLTLIHSLDPTMEE
jgi:hypothetical protein